MRYVKMTILKRFPGIGERPRERPVYGSDALHLAQRLRQDYWRQHKARGELALYKDMIAKNQRRAEGVSEVRRIEGFLSNRPDVWGSFVASGEAKEINEGAGLGGRA